MSTLIRTLLRLGLVVLLVVGLIALWEQVRGSRMLSRFRRDEIEAGGVLQEVTALGRLELVRYRFKDIVDHQQVNTFLPNARALLIIEGEATGCVDLTKLTTADIQSRGDTLRLHLPAPELCGWKIDHRRSRVYDTQFSWLTDAQLVSNAYRKAEQQVRQSALAGGILNQTRQNADQLLKPLLQRLTGRIVIITF